MNRLKWKKEWGKKRSLSAIMGFGVLITIGFFSYFVFGLGAICKVVFKSGFGHVDSLLLKHPPLHIAKLQRQAMIRSTICMLVLIFFGCEKNPTDSSDNQEALDCQPFFAFDRLDHFQIDIDQDSISYLRYDDRKIRLTPLQLRLSELLLSDSSMTMADTVRFSEIERLGYARQQVSKSEFGRINQLFCEGFLPEELKANVCLPAFRDILVFRDGGRIAGFAKLCFDCDQSVIVGTEKATYQFGQTGEFERLATILKLDKYY